MSVTWTVMDFSTKWQVSVTHSEMIVNRFPFFKSAGIKVKLSFFLLREKSCHSLFGCHGEERKKKIT